MTTGWKSTDLFLCAGLALILLLGAAQTPEIAERVRPAGFIAGELNRLERERARMRASFLASPETEARACRAEEDLAELDRMQQRLYSRDSGAAEIPPGP